MAKAKKKTQRKTGLMEKIKDLMPKKTRKKSSGARAYKNALANKKPGRMPIAENPDPAHALGHRRLSVKASPKGKKTRVQDESAENNMARNDRIKRNESNQRRIITGAAVGKTGRQLA